jgi:hypothetical protein
MATTGKAKNGKATKPTAKPATAKQTKAERVKAQREAEHWQAYQEAQLTAAAFVAAVRVKVLELTHEARRLECIMGHPDKRTEDVMLRCILDPGGVGRFISAAYKLEDSLDGMLAGDAEPVIPDLAGAIRHAAETYAAEMKAKVAS